MCGLIVASASKGKNKASCSAKFIHYASKLASHVGRGAIRDICIMSSIRQIYSASFKLLLSLAMLRKHVCVMQQEVQGLRSKCPKVEATIGKDNEHEVLLNSFIYSYFEPVS
jgi:hypothetical protein